MTGKIIGKRIVPDVFEVYEKDVGTNSIKFSVNHVNDGVNFTALNGYAHIDFENGRTDRVKLLKSIVGNDVFYELLITKAITYEEGRHRIQLSFESDDLSVVYKTCIFTFIVCESIDGNLAYENLIPSVVNELEEKMEETLLQCNNLKEETKSIAEQVEYDKSEFDSVRADCYNIKQQTEDFRHEAYAYSENAKQFYYDTIQGSYVTSINSKTGDVVLTANDIEGLQSNDLQPLFIDGVKYDGKTQVEVSTNGKSYQLVSEQEYDLHLQNNTCVYVKNIKRLNIYSDLLENLNGCTVDVYLQIREEIDMCASAKFYFYGDSCHFGIFKPNVGNYYMRFYSLEKNTTIHVEVKKLESIYWNYSLVQGFPAVVNYAKDVDYINNVVINGNTKLEDVNGTQTFAYPICGVGEPVIDENGKQKYKIQIITKSPNHLILPFCSDGVDSYSVMFDETLGQLYFYGITYMEYETILELSSPIEKNSNIYFNAFNMMSNISTEISNGCLIELTLASENSDLLKIGIDYMGNPCAVNGYSNNGYITEDIKYLKIKVLERAIETQFDNYVGLTVSKDAPLEQFEMAKMKVAEVYLDEPLLSIGSACDKFYLKDGYALKNITLVTINNKSELEALNTSDTAPAIRRYNSGFPTINMYGGAVWMYGKTREESSACLKIKSGYLEFDKDYFGTFANFDESVFPIRLLCTTMSTKNYLPIVPLIKVFEGNTTFYVSGGEKPSGGSVPNIKK